MQRQARFLLFRSRVHLLRGAAFLSLVVAVAVLLATAAHWPSRYALMTPGDALAVVPRVDLPPERRQPAGNLYFTVVNIQPLTWGEWAQAMVRPSVEEIVPRDEIEPPGIPREQVDAYNRQLMEESKVVASVVALRHAGFPVQVGGQGARVVAVLPRSPADGVLREGDVIQAVDGIPTPTVVDLVTQVHARRPGDQVRLTVRREDQTLQFDLTTVPSPSDPGRPMVGAMLLTELFDYHLLFPVTIQSDNITGPSAGLMFALGVYDLLTPGVLGNGHRVAGTGTIALDGTVGPVGGAAEKVAAAERNGLEIFLVPADDADEARRAARSIQVIPVHSFDDALEALQRLGPEPIPTLATAS